MVKKAGLRLSKTGSVAQPCSCFMIAKIHALTCVVPVQLRSVQVRLKALTIVDAAMAQTDGITHQVIKSWVTHLSSESSKCS